MKANQKGFSVIEVLLLIVVVGLVFAVGWLVYDRQNTKSSETSKTSKTAKTNEASPKKEETSEKETVTKFNATGFSVNTDKLPRGWTAEPDKIVNFVTLNTDGCFIEVIKENNATLSASKYDEGTQALLASKDKKSEKGYVVTEKGTSTLTIFTANGAEKVTSYEYLWDLSMGGNPFRYSIAYSIQDGYYISVRRNCASETDFTKTDAAMAALIFK
jgi:Tfp pilus assembly protein PilV